MKKLIFIIFVFISLGSFSISTGQSKFLTGKYSANTNSPMYTLAENSGDRSYTIEVSFLIQFESRPEVIVSVSSLDADKETNTRYSVEATAVSRDGFTIRISTWSDAKIYGIGGTWIAFTE